MRGAKVHLISNPFLSGQMGSLYLLGEATARIVSCTLRWLSAF